jgi:hypothetical protein
MRCGRASIDGPGPDRAGAEISRERVSGDDMEGAAVSAAVRVRGRTRPLPFVVVFSVVLLAADAFCANT